MRAKQFSIRARGDSLLYALEGIYRFFSREHNARLHALATVIVLIAMFYFRLPRYEKLALILVMGFVWATEILNTAIEKIMDFIQPDYDPRVKVIKDLSAASVLVAAFTAFVTGAYIFIPKIL